MTRAAKTFTPQGSIVRRIWGDADVVLFVFAGAAAEFALNRAVDWLFFTGRLPRDPLGRLFSTAAYAQQIALGDARTAEHTMERIRAAHAAVERQRDAHIPAWAHRDVLYLLVDYSERAFGALHRPLSAAERGELWEVFRRVGVELDIPELPPTYAAWRTDRERHLKRDLVFSEHTAALYTTYHRHLSPWRYLLLRQIQTLLVPEHVRQVLGLPERAWVRPLLLLYPLLTTLGLRPLIRRALVPPEHLPDVQRLDHPEVCREGAG